MIEGIATARYVRTSAQKAGLVMDLIRGRDVNDALARLLYSRKGVARDVSKVLRSAVANAQTEGKGHPVMSTVCSSGVVMPIRDRRRSGIRAAPMGTRFPDHQADVSPDGDSVGASGAGGASRGPSRRHSRRQRRQRRQRMMPTPRVQRSVRGERRSPRAVRQGRGRNRRSRPARRSQPGKPSTPLTQPREQRRRLTSPRRVSG